LCDVFGIRSAADQPLGEIKGGVEMRQDKHLETQPIL